VSRSHLWLLFALLSCLLVNGNSLYGQSRKAVQERADQFLALVNAGYQALYRVESEAQWLAATDVSPVHDAASETAGKARAAFVGNPALIREAMDFLAHRKYLITLTVIKLNDTYINKSEEPLTN